MSEVSNKSEMSMGQRLRMLREIENLSQVQLAHTLNVSEKTISAWETGGREIGLENAKSICNFFGVPNAWFCFGENYEKLEAMLRKKIEAYFEDIEFREKMGKILRACREKLARNRLTEKSYVPEFDYAERKFISYGLFREDRLPFRDGKIDEDAIVSSKSYEYSLSALAAENLEEIANCVDLTDIHLRDLVDCDSIKIFQMVFDKVQQEKYGHKSPQEEEHFQWTLQDDLNDTLENLSPHLTSFFEIVVFLIENGAYYIKQRGGGGGEFTVFWEMEDISKTNFFYRVALEMIK